MLDILNSAPWWAICILGVLIGFLAGVFSLDKKQHDGIIHIIQGEDTDKYIFEFNIPPEDVPKMSQVVFKTKIEESQELQSL